MLGLRTQETEKFNVFFELVQKKAKVHGAVFFLDSGNGNEFETETMEGENLQGWLVPYQKTADFKPAWDQWNETDEWVDYFCWVEWCAESDVIDVRFVTESGSVL